MTKHTQPAYSLKVFGDLLIQTETLLEKLAGSEPGRDIPFADVRLKLLTHIKDALGHGTSKAIDEVKS